MFEKFRKVASKLMYAVPVIVFLGFVFYMATMTYTGGAKWVVKNTKWNLDSYVALSDKFEKTLQRNIFWRYRFINLNGRIARYLEFNSLNRIQRLANGYLTWFNLQFGVEKAANSVIELNKFLSEKGIPFAFILVPDKNSIYDAKFAPGYGDESQRSVRNMIRSLDRAGVSTLDVDSWFRENNWYLDKVFFKTDHHWLPSASLAVAQRTMELLEQNGVAEYDKGKLDEKNYKIRILKRWYLGSHGKRTGKYFAGKDDFPVYLPKFSIKYTFFRQDAFNGIWEYRGSPLYLDLLENKDQFNFNGYAVYTGNNATQKHIINDDAINKKKVLVTGDSFLSAWSYFLSTQFQQITRIDLRYYTDGTLTQYIEENRPDIVFMLINAHQIPDKVFFNFGVDSYRQGLSKTKLNEPEVSLGDFVIKDQPENDDNFVTIAHNIETGQTYTLTMDCAKVLRGNNRHIQVTLQDLTTNKALVNHYFDVNSGSKQKWIFDIPKNTDNCAIYLYAGIKGRTAATSVVVKNVRLRKGIFED